MQRVGHNQPAESARAGTGTRIGNSGLKQSGGTDRGGAVRIRLDEPGEIGPSFSITDAVRDNKVEAGYTWFDYDQGGISAAALPALPAKLQQGDDRLVATNTATAAGTLGMLIPPGIMLVMMADRLAICVGNRFPNAVFPGLLIGLLNMTGVRDALEESTRSTARVFAILLGATASSLVSGRRGGDELIEGWFTGLPAFCLQTSFLTPPVGFSIYFPQGCGATGTGTCNRWIAA